MTASVITPGHIQCLRHLVGKGDVVVGLLTDKALKGYKKCPIPYKDRKFVLDYIALAVEMKHLSRNTIVVKPQEALDCTQNLKRYGCDFIASGDGFEPAEKLAADKLGVKLLNIKLRGEKKKKWSSSKILGK